LNSLYVWLKFLDLLGANTSKETNAKLDPRVAGPFPVAMAAVGGVALIAIFFLMVLKPF
jgi:hypothetical protein